MGSCSTSAMRRGRQEGFFSFLLQGFFVCSYGLSLLNVSCWMGEALYQKQPFIRRCEDSSDLTSAAIMLHQVGQLPSLAAEQGAGAGSKIKCAVSGFHSQGLCWLMLY